MKKFLPLTKAPERTFGYFLDKKSYPGNKILYVVEYPSPSRSTGFVFTLVLTIHEGRQGFDIQNNARFKLSKKGDEGVSFVDPPLGGAWTQERISSGIKQIDEQPRVPLTNRDVLAFDSSHNCEAYTDPQPGTLTR